MAKHKRDIKVSLNILVVKEVEKNENRVSATPETVKKLVGMGCNLSIESGAGLASSFEDEEYKKSGANIVKLSDSAVKKADIILCVQSPDIKIIDKMKKDALLVGMLSPYNNEKIMDIAAKKNITSFAMELVPRITRAQAMDVLSSQANLAGYKSVLDACEYFGRAFPMMMTAAGTVPPAKVFVMGAGVAGLQAIATAKRLGAIVCATDVRPAAKEQVESLGATFVAVEDDEFKQAESAGGYAKEMSKEYQKKQAELIVDTISKQDIVITTALIPGRPAPKLIDENMVKIMKAGSVIVDMAAPAGGNCTISEAGKVVKKHNVTIIAHSNIPSRIADSSSSLYARNIFNLLKIIIDNDGNLHIDNDDEIIKGITLTHNGEIVHPSFKKEEKKKTKAKTSPNKKTDSTKKTNTTKKKTSTKKTPAKKGDSKK